jgi:hypothetical protein
MSSKIRYVRTPLDRYEIAAVNRMLKAAGEVRVTRAMMNTCRPKYKNGGWDNCWFTQMFGGKANLNRMTQAWQERNGWTVPAPSALRAGCRRQARYQLGRREHRHLSLRRQHSRHPSTYDRLSSNVIDTTTVKLGKVVTFLEIVGRWLAKRGIDLTPVTFEAHKTVSVD